MQSQKQAFKLWGKGDSVVEQQQNQRVFFLRQPNHNITIPQQAQRDFVQFCTVQILSEA